MPTPSPAGAHATEARLAVVRGYEILDAPLDGSFDSVAAVAAAAYGVPIATVTIVDADRVWFAASHGLDGVSQIGAEPGLCASAVLSDDVYVVTDAVLDPRTLDHPLVRGEFGLAFYAAAPILTSHGHRLGTVNIIDRAAREVRPADLAMLAHLAAIVARQLDLRLAALVAVREERRLRAEAETRAAEAAGITEAMHAAMESRAIAEHPSVCRLAPAGENACAAPAVLKLADPAGTSAWGCELHVEHALIHVRAAFIADTDLPGLADYLARPGLPGTA